MLKLLEHTETHILSYLFRFTNNNRPGEYGSAQAGVELELHLLAYATAMATLDLSHIYHLCCSLWQCRILNSLREARDRTHILVETSQVLNLLNYNWNAIISFYDF